MPYFIWDESPECSGWAVVKEDGELVTCHKDKQSAIEHMVGVSAAEGIEPGGSYEEQDNSDEEELDQPEIRDTCEDCDGDCQVCNTETREVNLTPPAYKNITNTGSPTTPLANTISFTVTPSQINLNASKNLS